MSRLIKFFIQRSFVVNLLSIFLMIIGAISLYNMRRDLIPKADFKNILISVRLPGASPSQIEKSVTDIIEKSIQNIPSIKHIYSTSNNSSSSINLNLEDHIKDTSDILEKVKSIVLAKRNELPDGVEDIQVKSMSRDSFWYSSLDVLGFDHNNDIHRRWARKFISKLQGIKGIVQVEEDISPKNIYIKFSPEKLSNFGLTLREVERKIQNKFKILPLGSIKKDNKDISLEISSAPKTLNDIKNIIILSNSSGNKVLLKDISNIEFKTEEKKFYQETNLQKSLDITLFKDLTTDALTVKEELLKLIERENKNSPKDLKILLTGDGPAYIERQLKVLKNNAIFGIILVLITLYLFLGAKTSIMTAFGIPVAYLLTFFCLSQTGMAIDLISVIGLLLVLGIIVDDAIVVSEQYSQLLEKGSPPKEAALLAVKETIIPITGSTITTIIAFMPILFSTGGLNQMLKAIPLAVLFSLSISWLESFFILPNHLSHFVKKPIKEKKERFDKIKNVYKSLLRFSLKWRYPLSLVFISFSVFTFIFAQKKVPMKFNLRVGSEKIKISAILKKSDSIEESIKKLKPISNFLSTISKEDYSYISTTIGSDYIDGERKVGPEYARIYIRFSQTFPNIKEKKEKLTKLLDKELPKLKTNHFEKLSSKREISGYQNAQDDLLALYLQSDFSIPIHDVLKSIRQKASKIEGKEDVYIDSGLNSKTWRFILDPKAKNQYNLSPFDITEQISGHILERDIQKITIDNRETKILTSFNNVSDEKSVKTLKNLPIILKNGQTTKLENLGKWVGEESLSYISHMDLKRRVRVSLSFDKKKVKKEIFQKKIMEILPDLIKTYPDISFNLQDADEESRKNKSEIGEMFIYSLLLIILVLALVLGSISQPFIICLSIPFGVVGVIWAFYFHQIPLSIMGIVGVIGMAGVVVNDSLVMVTTINKLKKEGQSHREAILNGASSRLRAIILTSITTLGGVFPMAYGIGGESGFTSPLALSLGWGLLCSTLLTLVLLPSLQLISVDIGAVFSKIYLKLAKKDPEEILFDLPSNEVSKENFEVDIIPEKIKDDLSNKTNHLQ